MYQEMLALTRELIEYTKLLRQAVASVEHALAAPVSSGDLPE